MARGQVVSEGGFIGLGDHVRIDTMEDARYHVSARRAVGVESLKNFRVANRKKHQFLIEAARERHMPVTAEGASPILALGFAMDGQTRLGTRDRGAARLFKDMTTFLAKTGVTHSPTMTIIGWPDGTQTYFRPYAHLEKDPMYRYVASKSFIDGRNARSMVQQPKERFWHPVYAEGSADIQRAGGYVTSGEHGEQPGIGTHWDIWTFADAMTEMEALYTATVAGAHFLGAEDQIGSLKAGKLADLVVLNNDLVAQHPQHHRYRLCDDGWPVAAAFHPRPGLAAESADGISPMVARFLRLALGGRGRVGADGVEEGCSASSRTAARRLCDVRDGVLGAFLLLRLHGDHGSVHGRRSHRRRAGL